jgi:hypothetical protein
MATYLRKKRVVFTASFALLCAFFAAALAATQFYQPNRSARLVVALKARDHYRTKPVTVTVMLSNQSQGPLLINNRMLFNQYPHPGELSFQIEGPKHTPYPLVKAVMPHDIKDSDLTVLPSGQTMEQIADLTDMYALYKRGNYKVQVIYYNSIALEKDGLSTWRGTIASEPTELTLD